MRTSMHLSLALAAGLLPAAPAAAQDYALHTLGDWTVAASKDQSGCFATRTYDGTGATTLLLGLDVDGSNRLSVLNDNWSIKPRQALKLRFRLSSGGYVDHPVVGIAADGKQGFVTSFEAKFPEYLAGSNALDISRGDVPVEALDLAGSGAAVAELRRCVALFKAAPPRPRARDRAGQIPRDPFAPASKRRSRD
ncbi:hypothetical protein U1872_19190 [Sphingomonas sp. RB3P16]|uniref:hypothetical protein n=1 Tax=Parasphingomonas frigoris TaxID=3096163 RepID=UPI002FC72FCF